MLKVHKMMVSWQGGGAIALINFGLFENFLLVGKFWFKNAELGILI